MTKSKLPPAVEENLTSPIFYRQNPNEVTEGAAQLGLEFEGLFEEFFRRYEGMFGSDTIPFELLDILVAVSMTYVCRREHGFPNHYVVLSELCGGEVLVYDTVTDGVHQVDFEGGDEELRAGTAKPRWPSFEAFLVEYF